MEFDIHIKNFRPEKSIKAKLDKSLLRLGRTLKSFDHLDKPATVILEKRAKREEYKAKVTFHLPKHTISTRDAGFTPEQALHNAAEDARDLVLKLKDRLKDRHERRRRSRIDTIRELPET